MACLGAGVITVAKHCSRVIDPIIVGLGAIFITEPYLFSPKQISDAIVDKNIKICLLAELIYKNK